MRFILNLHTTDIETNNFARPSSSYLLKDYFWYNSFVLPKARRASLDQHNRNIEPQFCSEIELMMAPELSHRKIVPNEPIIRFWSWENAADVIGWDETAGDW